jgi:HSP20 family protein
MFGRTMFDEVNDFRRSFDQLFDSFWSGQRRLSGDRSSDWSFVPAVETGWTDDYLNLRVVLPGVTQENVRITAQGNSLTVQGERHLPENFGKEGAVYNQMAYGRFERTLELPTGLDLENLHAWLHDGVLDIRIPVAQAVKPKHIPINAGAETKSISS